jgi:7,8-dihydropterin-6-yl-methyl-4-(beta-D-ribofuranosyl)aminobenzene 5'-phosphate synthase
MFPMKSKPFCWFVCGVLFGLLVCSSVVATAGAPDGSLTAVSGHQASKSKAELYTKGGLSTYVKIDGKAILFDIGGDAASLLSNLEKSGLDPALIEAIVFSHNQSDRVFGMTDLLNATEEKPKVFALPTLATALMESNANALVVAVSKPTRILPDTWIVGPIELEIEGDTVYEQALVLDQPDGLIVIVGCSHPAVVSVVQQVKEVFGHRRIQLVAGAVHLQKIPKDEIREISLKLQQKGVQSLALSNCTGEPAMKIFRQEWGDNLLTFDAGDTLRF